MRIIHGTKGTLWSLNWLHSANSRRSDAVQTCVHWYSNLSYHIYLWEQHISGSLITLKLFYLLERCPQEFCVLRHHTEKHSSLRFIEYSIGSIGPICQCAPREMDKSVCNSNSFAKTFIVMVPKPRVARTLVSLLIHSKKLKVSKDALQSFAKDVVIVAQGIRLDIPVREK